MVTGIPGSGKTVILLARAIHLIKENPHWNILILTYNKSLKCKINNKLDKLAENFKKDINNNLINIEKIKVMHFHGLTSLLTKGRRAETENLDTWFKEKVVEIASRNARPMYDAILIDEYQDFYMNWIELCVKLCKECTSEKDNKKYKNIFLAGDRLQSIYNNKDISWKSIGIDMRGRSKLLKTSYRSAKEHMTLALNFLKNDKTLKTEVEKFYKDEFDDANLEALNSGSVEFISGNLELIGDKILELKDKGYKNEDFLILANNKNQCNLIINQCKSSIKYEMRFIKEISENDIDKNIILTTYQSSKGLEAKVVFLINLDEIYTSNDKEEQLKRKTVYVGITRASEKLFIHRGLGKSEKLVTELMSLNNNGNSKF